MTGAGAVLALVLTEWATGWIGAAAWSQSWRVIRRGHFRITASITLVLAVLATVALRAPAESGSIDGLAAVFALGALCYLAGQYLRSDLAGAIVGGATALVGMVVLIVAAGSVAGWPHYLAAVELVTGALLLGGVTNGMMLGHWYLNQPGLKPWALARMTNLSAIATIASVLAGIAGVRLLTQASTEGAALGLVGFGRSLGTGFYAVWALLIVFTGAVVLGARRCIQIRSIQSATGLYYVALLTAGVAQFLITYLLVNAR